MIAHSDHPIHPFDAIATKFNRSENKPSSAHPSNDEEKAIFADEFKFSPPPPISPENIKAPALILSPALRITWQNAGVGTHIWHQPLTKRLINDHMDVFDILYTTDFQNTVQNWRQWVAFFIQQALTMVSMDELEHRFATKTEHHGEKLLAMLTDFLPAATSNPPGDVSDLSGSQIFGGCLRQVLPENRVNTYQIIGMGFEKGRLLIFEPVAPGQGGHHDRTVNGVADSPVSLLVGSAEQPFNSLLYILSASLNNAEILTSELLSKDYSRLLNRLWKVTRDTIEQYEGVFSHYQSSGLIGYFISAPNEERNPIHVIQCALELKNRIADLAREWKIQKGWLHTVELNMGIHAGTEYLTAMPSTLGNNIVPLGNTLVMATYLSAIARDGQIWTSKALIDQIPSQALDALRFGIFRSDQARQIFIPKCFSRIKDLTGVDHLKPGLWEVLETRAVTQVFDYHGEG